MSNLPYPSWPVVRRDTFKCIVDWKCPECGATVAYSGSYFICDVCKVQMPNFPERQ